MRLSLATAFQNVFNPSVMIWTSTECWQASKEVIVMILPCLKRYPTWITVANMSKRDRNMALAKEAVHWRRQQTFNVNKLPPADRVQTLENIISNLRSRQPEIQRLEPVATCRSPEMILPPNVLHVKAARASNQEVLLRCDGLNLMNLVDDPVWKIDGFRPSTPSKGQPLLMDCLKLTEFPLQKKK